MTARELLRMSMLADMCNRLSDSDRLLLLQSFKYEESQAETLARIESKIDKQTFTKDLLANISGNAISYALYWVGRTLLGRL